MSVEKSAGAVIFRREGNKIYYLLLQYPSGARAPKVYWDFPKGHLEKGEKEIETVKREIKEETGLRDIKFTEGFKEWVKYFFKLKEKTVFKIVTFYLVEAETEKVKISFEHTDFKWLPYQEAIEQLTFKNAKEILKRANNFLRQKSFWNSEKNLKGKSLEL